MPVKCKGVQKRKIECVNIEALSQSDIISLPLKNESVKFLVSDFC